MTGIKVKGCRHCRDRDAYDKGVAAGKYRRENDDYDPRWDFADHAKAGTFDAFEQGFEAGFEGGQ